MSNGLKLFENTIQIGMGMRCLCAEAQKQVDKSEIYLAISSYKCLPDHKGTINYVKCIIIMHSQQDNDKRVVKALIKNFQYRIQLLESVMMQIELVKEIKTQNHEII